VSQKGRHPGGSVPSPPWGAPVGAALDRETTVPVGAVSDRETAQSAVRQRLDSDPNEMPPPESLSLAALRALEQNPDLTQRQLARELGVSLGSNARLR